MDGKHHRRSHHGDGVRAGKDVLRCLAALLLVPGHGVVGNVHGQLGYHGCLTLFGQLGAAMRAVIPSVCSKADGGSHLKLYAPVLPGPPGVSAEETAGPVSALITELLHLRVEGDFHCANVEVGVYCIGTNKPALVNLVKVVAHLRHNGKVAPVGGVVLVPVPGQPAGPCLQGKVAAD